MSKGKLGRKIPKTFEHVQKHPLRMAEATAVNVEKRLPLPYWHWRHNQGDEGACVGFGCGMMMSIINEMENREAQRKPYSEPYDCFALYHMAQEVDEWDDTPPEEGTSVSAGADIMRSVGLISLRRKSSGKPEIVEGILENQWAYSVDQMRTYLAVKEMPMAIGVNWYGNFDKPKPKGREWWIGEGSLGSIRGGHCLCVYGASDKREAFALKNSWGKLFPLVWMPYSTMERLLQEDGECTMVTDRVVA